MEMYLLSADTKLPDTQTGCHPSIWYHNQVLISLALQAFTHHIRILDHYVRLSIIHCIQAVLRIFIKFYVKFRVSFMNKLLFRRKKLIGTAARLCSESEKSSPFLPISTSSPIEIRVRDH